MKTFIYKLFAPMYRLYRFFYTDEYATSHIVTNVSFPFVLVNFSSVYLFLNTNYHLFDSDGHAGVIIHVLAAIPIYATMYKLFKADEMEAVCKTLSKTGYLIYSIAFLAYAISTFALWYFSIF